MNKFVVILVLLSVILLIINITGLSVPYDGKAKRPLDITGLILSIILAMLLIGFSIKK